MVRTLLTAIFLLALGRFQPVWAAEPPALPCGDSDFVFSLPVDAPPAVAVWSGNDLGANWRPPVCTGWQVGPSRWVVAVSGQFRGPATTDEILARVGGVSRLKSVRYWSVTGKHWKDLLSSAQAVTAANGKARADFSAEEIRTGQDFHFVLNDNTTYRGRVTQATKDRIAFAIENLTSLKFMLMSLFSPGDIKFFCIIARQPGGAWTYHSLVRIGAEATGMGAADGGSYINRAVAYYRHIAGIPTNQEPPAVR
jgi:hypothetical protein